MIPARAQDSVLLRAIAIDASGYRECGLLPGIGSTGGWISATSTILRLTDGITSELSLNAEIEAPTGVFSASVSEPNKS